MTKTVTYKCILHYKDGLNKNLDLSELELDATLDVWTEELVSDGGDRLVYLKIRATDYTLEDKVI